jgi:protein-tyrosine phosphatase
MTRVLFVCLGNICRSPAAEGIFRHKALSAKTEILVDSVGTGGWHVGESPDDRMIAHASKRGYDLSSLVGRQFDAKKDFVDFDLILTMDDSNFAAVCALDREGRYKNKIRKASSFCKIHQVTEVPDPYYKGDDGFELVLDILEDACDELLKTIEMGTWK